MIALLSVILFLWICAICKIISTRKNEDGFSLYHFGIEESTSLKGILILGVVLSHLQIFCFKPQDYPIINGFAVLAQVGIFFFISGYGLTSSFQKKGQLYLHGFLSHRLFKIIIPLLIATCLYLIEVQLFIGGVFSSMIPYYHSHGSATL